MSNGKALRNRVNGVASEDSSRNLPPVKRLRLRGDWSDTGPNARPENEQDREENNTSMHIAICVQCSVSNFGFTLSISGFPYPLSHFVVATLPIFKGIP